MVALINTNVIMDFLMKREPYAEDAIEIVDLCKRQKITGYLAAHTISNLFYILRKDFSVLQRKEILNALCGIFGISGIDKRKILSALESGAEYIIIRNPLDFVNSRISAMEPGDFRRGKV